MNFCFHSKEHHMTSIVALCTSQTNVFGYLRLKIENSCLEMFILNTNEHEEIP